MACLQSSLMIASMHVAVHSAHVYSIVRTFQKPSIEIEDSLNYQVLNETTRQILGSSYVYVRDIKSNIAIIFANCK
jgi:hypothetical protein